MAARTGPHPDVPCTGNCGTMLKHNPRRLGTRCRACSDNSRKLIRFCKVCGKKLNPRRKNWTGLCRVHAARSEERVAKVRAALRIVHADPEYQRRRGRAITAAALAHIPLEYRSAYRDLMRKQGLTAAECCAVIANQVEADTRKYLTTGALPQTTRNPT